MIRKGLNGQVNCIEKISKFCDENKKKVAVISDRWPVFSELWKAGCEWYKSIKVSGALYFYTFIPFQLFLAGEILDQQT